MATSTRGTAVVTGASSGIGAIYADRLARRGYDLILVARNQVRLDAVADRIAGATGRAVKTVAADLNNKADLKRVETILGTDRAITMLVNNAGIGALEPLLQSDIGAMEDMINLNVTALTRLTYAAAPAFVARGGGAIINISSVVAVAPEVLNGVYGASKAFVLALSQSLHKELADKSVRIQVVLPGATATNSGIPRAAHSKISRARSSCDRTTLSTPPLPASIRVNSLRSPRFLTLPIGSPMKAHASGSCRTSRSAPCRRDTGWLLRRSEDGIAHRSRTNGQVQKQ